MNPNLSSELRERLDDAMLSQPTCLSSFDDKASDGILSEIDAVREMVSNGDNQHFFPPTRGVDEVKKIIAQAERLGMLEHLPHILRRTLDPLDRYRDEWLHRFLFDFFNPNGFYSFHCDFPTSVLQQMESWEIRHREALTRGYVQLTGEGLCSATSWVVNQDKGDKWYAKVQGVYTPTGIELHDGVRWEFYDAGGGVNISSGNGVWTEPCLQPRNKYGYHNPVGWLFRIEDAYRT